MRSRCSLDLTISLFYSLQPNMRSRYWNPPTSIALPAGTGLSYSILLGLTSSGQRSRNSKLIDRGEPVLQVRMHDKWF